MIEREWNVRDDIGDDLRYFKNCVQLAECGMSKYDLAVKTMELCSLHRIFNVSKDILEIVDSSEFLAKRPKWSVLKPSENAQPMPRNVILELNRYILERYCS